MRAKAVLMVAVLVLAIPLTIVADIDNSLTGFNDSSDLINRELQEIYDFLYTGGNDTDRDGVNDTIDNCPNGISDWVSNNSTDLDGDGCKDKTFYVDEIILVGNASNDAYLFDIETDRDGFLYIVGWFNGTIEIGGYEIEDSTTSYSGFIAKLHPNGSSVWVVQINGSYDSALNIKVSISGDIYVSGDGLKMGNTTISGEFVAKFGNDGQLVWASAIQNINGYSEDSAAKVEINGDGNILTTYGCNMLLLNSSNGVEMWNITPSTTSYCTSLVVSSYNEGQIFAGWYEGTFSIGSYQFTPKRSTRDAFLVVVDNDGNIIAATNIYEPSTSGSPTQIEVRDVAIDNSNNIYVTGFIHRNTTFGMISASAIGTTMFIAKYSSSFSWSWVRLINSSMVQVSSASSYGRGLEISDDGDLFAIGTIGAGYLNSQYFGYDWSIALRIDPASGNLLNWTGFSMNSSSKTISRSSSVSLLDYLYLSGGSSNCFMCTGGKGAFYSKISLNGEDQNDDNDSFEDSNDSCVLGVINWESNFSTDYDSDGCFDPGEDTDDDNDGVVDSLDNCPTGVLNWTRNSTTDYDDDGCRDSDEDLDDDGDSVNDSVDSCKLGNNNWLSNSSTDNDGDGCRDSTEDDNDDNDDFLDIYDSCSAGDVGWESNSTSDYDSDGCRDSGEDTDDDNDAVSDVSDDCQTGKMVWTSSTLNDHDTDGCYDESYWEWAETAVGSTTSTYDWDYAYAVDTDAQGNVYIAGNFQSPSLTLGNLTLNKSVGVSNHLFVAKKNSDGGWEWATKVDSSSGYYNFLKGISVDGNGNVFACGRSDATTNANGKFFVVKLNSSGSVSWSSKSSIAGGLAGGYAIAADGNGGAIVAGNRRSSITLGSTTLSGSGVVIARINSTGSWQWAIGSTSGTTSGPNDVGYGVAIDSSGNIFVTGTIYSMSTSFGTYSINVGAFIVKVNGNGSMIWAKSTYGVINTAKEAKDIVLDSFGSAIIVGDDSTGLISGLNGGFVAKLSSNGAWIWTKTVSGSPTGIDIDDVDNLYISISTTSTFTIASKSVSGAIAALMNSDGQWINAISSTKTAQSSGHWEFVNDIAYSGNNSTILVGGFDKSVIKFGTISIGNNICCDYEIFIASTKLLGEDIDDDDDSMNDATDDCPLGHANWVMSNSTDHDTDGCFDANEDTDDDNDGILDNSDNCPRGELNWTPSTSNDRDSDGCRDATEDVDDDGDGINDNVDSCPTGMLNYISNPTNDHDSDGCEDFNEDDDDDNDGMLDVSDLCSRGDLNWTSSSSTDYDDDGCRDAGEDVDDDDDSILDSFDTCQTGQLNWTSTSVTDHDTDGCRDSDEDSDDDNDGIQDITDACPVGDLNWTPSSATDHDSDGCRDAGEDTDDDDDGVMDISDYCPTGLLGWTSTSANDRDGDGCRDVDEDLDDDHDGITDADDACPLGALGWISTSLTDHDSDGCRDSDEDDDDDNDGLIDSSDDCSSGDLGWNSTASTDYDSDGCRDSGEDLDDDSDGITDSLDLCAKGDLGWISQSGNDHDSDGCRDSTEDADWDNDGMANEEDDCEYGTIGWDSSGAYDHDGDGCRDDVEDDDDDSDGVLDQQDSCPLGEVNWSQNIVSDYDFDGCRDSDEDDDDDNDTIGDTWDSCVKGFRNWTSVIAVDYDSDGCRDSDEDIDDDDDSVEDDLDECPKGLRGWTSTPLNDIDGDGCEDATEDSDDDGDGVLDVMDSCPEGKSAWSSNNSTDYDGDGCFDSSEDSDDDNDGITDSIDNCQIGELGWFSEAMTDYDSDGCYDPIEDDDDDNDSIPDDADNCPYGMKNWTSTQSTDWDGDGCNDSNEDNDDDNDSILDFNDMCQKGDLNWSPDFMSDYDTDGCRDAGGDLDDDNDGVFDFADNCAKGRLDWNSTSANDKDADGCQDDGEDPDDDGDGVLDSIDDCLEGPINWVSGNSTDNDGDGCKDDTEDGDDDNDGLRDEIDSCPSGFSNWTSRSENDHDSDGCRDDGEDTDDDNDDVHDDVDSCPNGQMGWKSTTSVDHDLDGCLDATEDVDDDNDGILDAIEIKEGSDPLDSQSIPVETFSLVIGQVELGVWDLMGIVIAILTSGFLMFSFVTRGGRYDGFSMDIEEARYSDLRKLEKKLELASFFRLLSPRQSIKLESLLDARKEDLGAGIQVETPPTFPTQESMTPSAQVQPPMAYQAGVLDDKGYEWIKREDGDWYRVANSGTEYTLFNR